MEPWAALNFLEGKCNTNKEHQIISPATETPLPFIEQSIHLSPDCPTWDCPFSVPLQYQCFWPDRQPATHCTAFPALLMLLLNPQQSPTLQDISICCGSLANNLFNERCHSTHSKSVCFFKLSSCCSEIDYEFPRLHWAVTPDAPAHLCLGQVAACVADHELVSRATVMQKATMDTQEGARAVERTTE